MGRWGGIACALVALVTALVAAPSASAASIVFTVDGDLVLATPDGKTERRIADVDPSTPLRAPSPAPDGTVWAIFGGGFVRISPLGAVVATLAPAVPGTLVDLAVSPDGTRLAYVLTDAAGARTTWYARTDGTGGEAEFGGAAGWGGPSWIDANRVALDNGAGDVAVDVVEAGATPPVVWFSDPAAKPIDGAVNGSLAFGAWIVTVDGETRLGLYTTAGGPPAAPPRNCTFRSVGGHDPDWSPDGGSVAWADNQGVWVAPIPGLADCGSLTASRITPDGAREPEWSPIDIPAGVPGTSADGKPRVTGLALAATTFPGAVGTTMGFTATASGTATVTFYRVSTGMRKARGCVAGTAKRKPQRCALREPFGAPLQQAVAAGPVSVALLRPDLTPGAYEARVTATDAIGRNAAPKRIRFTVQ